MRVVTAIATSLLCAWCAATLASAQRMRVPRGCVAVKNAAASHDGYASGVKHKKTGIELVLLPAGSFKSDDRQITFAKPFYVGRTEVTNGQYKRFMEQSGYDGLPDVDPGYELYLLHLRGRSTMPTGDDFPIVFVSWHNAKAFCQWSGELELPSDAQWSYCAQAPRTEGTEGWIMNISGGHTHEVARRKPNAWGIHDLFGNVWEWCLDDHVLDAPLPSDGSARRREGQLTKVLRGGSWSTRRSWAGRSVNQAPGNAANDAGFRVVMPLP